MKGMSSGSPKHRMAAWGAAAGALLACVPAALIPAAAVSVQGALLVGLALLGVMGGASPAPERVVAVHLEWQGETAPAVSPEIPAPSPHIPNLKPETSNLPQPHPPPQPVGARTPPSRGEGDHEDGPPEDGPPGATGGAGPERSRRVPARAAPTGRERSPAPAEPSADALDRALAALLGPAGGASTSGPPDPAALYGLRSAEGRRAASASGWSGGASSGAGAGATADAERAVEAARAWLARHQDPDGRWSASDFERHCTDGACGGAGFTGREVGATALSLLAMLGAGATHRAPGPYQTVVARGLRWLVRAQDLRGRFEGTDTYEHALAAAALAEARAMTGDAGLALAVERAAGHLVATQAPGGGWDYRATGRESDLSITAFVVQALIAARAAGVELPARTWHGVIALVRAHTLPDGRVRYRSDHERPTLGTQAAALFMRVALGDDPRGPTCRAAFDVLLCDDARTDDRRSLAFDATRRGRRPSTARWAAISAKNLDDTLCTWYYAGLAGRAAGDAIWADWIGALAPILIAAQSRAGETRGSWAPVGPWIAQAGRVGTTALAALMLEGPYRFAPAALRAQAAPLAPRWRQ